MRARGRRRYGSPGNPGWNAENGLLRTGFTETRPQPKG
jgi:hypothetical protein